jgi:hypothetical protein
MTATKTRTNYHYTRYVTFERRDAESHKLFKAAAKFLEKRDNPTVISLAYDIGYDAGRDGGYFERLCLTLDDIGGTV